MSGSPGRSQRPQEPAVEFDTDEWRKRVQERALPVLDYWGRGQTLDTVRNRLRSVFGASAFVVVVQLFFDPGGLTGTLLSVWFFVSLPVGAIAGCLLVLLRNPGEAPTVWFEENLPATVGLVGLATLARGSRSSPAGWTAWRLLFATDPPENAATEPESGSASVDLEEVARLRQYVQLAILGSVAVAVLEQLLGGGVPAVSSPSAPSGPSIGIGLSLSPVEWALVAVGGTILGAIVGAVLAVTEW